MAKLLRTLLTSIVIFFSWAGICFGENITLTMLDVDQADALLIQTSTKTVLIDAGESKDLVRDLLRKKNIRNLDLVVATHPHADHVGGMLEVLKNFSVKTYIDNGFPHTTKQYTDLMDQVESLVTGGTKYLSARQGQKLNLIKGEAVFEVLWPNNEGFKDTRSDINANSIVMKLTHGDVCMLFMGDAEAETEEVVTPLLDKCQILKVSHHGTPHSSIPSFLDRVQPETALISCGLANKHGHPGKTTLNEFAKRKTKVYRTDWMGEITVVSDGKNYTVTTEKNLTQADLPCIDVNNGSSKDFGALNGVGDGTIKTIMAARKKNGHFNTVDEFLAALPQDPAHRLDKLRDYLAVDCSNRKSGSASTAAPTTAPAAVAEAPAPGGIVDINTATEAELAALPGMDGKKAAAAIEYRNQNGPFANCKSMSKVKGIGVKTVEKFESVCTAGTVAAAQPAAPAAVAAAPAANGMVNINTATEAELAALPGMDSKKAAAAIEYRTQNGPFANCKSMTKVKGIGAKTVEKFESICTTGNTTVQAPAAQAPVQAAPAADGMVNINTANAAAIKAMPGMDATKAEKAIEYREANGPFKSCKDLSKVKGIGVKTVEKLLSVCTTGNTPAAQAPVQAAPAADGLININTANAGQLKTMPGMDATKAENAIEYREANGPFKSCKELSKVKGIGAKTVEKLSSVCTVN